MHTLKFGLEKPSFIWVLVVLVYSVLFWTTFRGHPVSPHEEQTYRIVEQFAQSSFPPRIQLIRELPDWGHVGFYAIFGQIYNATAGNVEHMRIAGLALMLLSFLMFVRLGTHFTYKNRLSPLWVSLALLVLAVNPYSWLSAVTLHYVGLLLLFLFIAAYFFEIDQIGLSAFFLSLGVLVDWRALLLAFAIVITRMTGEKSRLLRPERLIAFIFPFIIGSLPLLAWNGIVPQGQATEWLAQVREKLPVARLDSLFYCMALLPVYGIFFSWAWGIRARSRALGLGAIWTAVLIPLYFLFPIKFDYWAELSGAGEQPLGFVDQGALLVAGPYKNLLLFVPWLAGAFLFLQLVLMDVLDRSRWLRYFIILFFLVQPFILGSGDQTFLILAPFVLLLSLSEALVGEEGKLA